MTTKSTLTDRYVAATLRSVPGKQRNDIEEELRALIADAVEDRHADGVDAEAAEREVLADLGSPARLAARYSEKSLYLIGPELYLDYTRALTVLLSTVVPLWFVFFGLVSFVDGASPAAAVGAALYSAFQVAMSLAFIVTLVFVIIERSSAMHSRPKAAWDPTSLPEVRDKRGYLGELVGGVIFLLVIVSGLVLAQTVGAVEGPGGTQIGPIASELWESGALYIGLLFAVASISLHLFAYYTGWSTGNAIANTLLGVLFVVPVIWITASGRLLNDDYFSAVGWPEGAGIVTVVVAVVFILLPVIDTIDGFVKASRIRRTR